MPSGSFELRDLESMWRIRALEEEILRLRLAGSIVGSVHLCNGQEAIAVGVCSVLRPQDALFVTYRGHGWAVARGVPFAGILAELLARRTGVNSGRGGSAYFSAPDYGFFGENSIVGAGAPIAVGSALASTFDNSGRVAIAVFGDGAMNQGGVTEAMNFAAAKNLPVVFICENNKYSELTPIDTMVRNPDLSARAHALGIPTVQVDGNECAQVRSAAQCLIQAAANGMGPSFIEASTRRIVGHYIGDSQLYRPKGELDRDLAREPIVRLQRVLRASGVPDQSIDAIERRVRAEVDKAVELALAAPPVDASRVREHVYE